MQKSSKAQGANNEPIWFGKPSAEGDTEVTTINIGTTSPHKIMVCTPVHSDVSMHYCQAVLKFQQDCMQRKICLLYTSPSPRDRTRSRMPSSA